MKIKLRLENVPGYMKTSGRIAKKKRIWKKEN